MAFNEKIRAKLKEKQWSVKRFADEIGRSPEHARKIRNGAAFPSRDLVETIADKLELDYAEFRDQVELARWEKAHGRKPPQAVRPEFGALEEVWAELSAEQRECVICIAKCITVTNQKRRIFVH